MCACIILRDGKTLTFDGAQEFPGRQGDRQVQAAGTHGDHDRLPALDVRQGLEEGSASRRCRRRWRPAERADHRPALLPEYQRVDRVPAAVRRRAGRVLGPRLGGKKKRRSCKTSPTPASRRCWSRSISKRPSHAAVLERLRRGDAEAPSRDGSSRRGASVDPFKGDDAIREAQARDRRLGMLGFHFHPIMGHYAVNDRALYPLFETIDALSVPVMIDVGTTGMGAGMPGGDGREAAPRAPGGDRRTRGRFPEPHDHRRASRLAVGRRDDGGRAAQGQRLLGAVRLGAQVLPAAAQRSTSARGSKTRSCSAAITRACRTSASCASGASSGYKDEVMEGIFHGNAERVLALPAAAPDRLGGAGAPAARRQP